MALEKLKLICEILQNLAHNFDWSEKKKWDTVLNVQMLDLIII